MKNRILFFSVVCMLFLLSSCTKRLSYNYEQLRSGKLITPLAGRSILLIDNSALQPKDKGHIFAVNNELVGDTVFNTDDLSTFLLNSIVHSISEIVPFSSVEIVRNNSLAPKIEENDYLYAAPLSNSVLKDLSADPKKQLVLSLDLLYIMSVTHSHFTKSVISCSTRDVLLQSIWRIYDLEKDRLLLEYECLDSMYWKKDGNLIQSSDKLLPPMDDVMEEIGDVLAKKVLAQLLPNWEKVNREYFCRGSMRMRVASDWVRLDSLDKAAALWEKEFSVGVFRTKYRSAMNMMLYYEVMGKPEVSLLWADKALQAMTRSPFGSAYDDEDLLSTWKLILQNRVKENKLLQSIFVEL